LCGLCLKYVTDVIGYPRTLSQAKDYWDYCQKHGIDTKAVHIDLAVDVVKQKLKGRRVCKKCGHNFNIADVVNHGYVMPAIPRTKDNCPRGNHDCQEPLITRHDDFPEVVDKRIQVFDKETEPLIEFFKSKNCLISFPVRKGVEDTDDLIRAMSPNESYSIE
jgi:adenylate kinase